jgi:predicted MFS family arabinose efflux permease
LAANLTESQPYPSRRYAWFVVFVLIIASLIAFIDRQVVAIVVGPMKADLGVGDTEIGWLYGVFALFYAIAAVPIATLAAVSTLSQREYFFGRF